MAPPSSKQLSSYNGAQGNPGGSHDWQLWQNPSFHSSMVAVDDSSSSLASNAPQNATMLSDVRDNFNMPVAAFDCASFGLDGHFNELHNFVGSLDAPQSWTDPDAMLDIQYVEWNRAFGIASFPGMSANTSSLFDLPIQHQPETIQVGGIGGRSDVHIQNMEPSDAGSDQLLLTPIGPYPLPFQYIQDPTVDNYSVGDPMLDFQYELQTSSLPPTIIDDQHSSILPFQMTVSSESRGQSSKDGGCWSHTPQEDIIYDRVQTFPSNNSPDTTYDMSDSLVANKNDSCSLETENTILKTPENRIAVQQPCLIAAKPAVSSPAVVDGTNKIGRRRGPLLLTTKRKAALVRKNGACALCRVNKLGCTPHGICERCLKQTETPFGRNPCCRGHLQLYNQVLSSCFFDGHLQHGLIESETNNFNFIENEIMVRDEEYLSIPDVTLDSNDHMQTFARVDTLPYGLRRYRINQLEKRCLEHIEAISTWEYISGDSVSLSGKLLRAAFRFQGADPSAQQNDLLRRAIMVNTIHYVKGLLITFSEDSAPRALESLQNPPANPPRSFLSARLLNRQIKGVFAYILRDLQKKVLEDFDLQLQPNQNDNWALCLCIFLVLSKCVEDIQVAIDGFAFEKISQELGDPKAANKSRKEAVEICRRLDQYILHSWIFVYAKLAGIRKKPNKFIYGYMIGDESNHSESEMNLVKDIRQILIDHREEIERKAAYNDFGGSSKIVKEHKIFRKRNSARSSSKALKMLLKGSE